MTYAWQSTAMATRFKREFAGQRRPARYFKRAPGNRRKLGQHANPVTVDFNDHVRAEKRLSSKAMRIGAMCILFRFTELSVAFATTCSLALVENRVLRKSVWRACC